MAFHFDQLFNKMNKIYWFIANKLDNGGRLATVVLCYATHTIASLGGLLLWLTFTMWCERWVPLHFIVQSNLIPKIWIWASTRARTMSALHSRSVRSILTPAWSDCEVLWIRQLFTLVSLQYLFGSVCVCVCVCVCVSLWQCVCVCV